MAHQYGWAATAQRPSQSGASSLQKPSLQELMAKRLAYEDLSKRRKELPVDVLLDYTPLDKGLQAIKTLFSTLPKTLVKGLRGDKDFSFSDAMLVAKVPYYLGGAFLASSFLLGGNKLEGIRQGTAVILYLLGTAGSNFAINTLYRLRYGVDLTMMYRSKNGNIEKVFASADFPRFDLLKHHHYQRMAKKMGIPPEVYEQDGAVREQLRYITSSSRALKLIVANLFSAIGAGYLARSNAWAEVPKALPVLRSLIKDPKLSLLKKLSLSTKTVSHALSAPLFERLNMAKANTWQKVIVYGGLATMVGTVLYILGKGTAKKEYTTGSIGPLDEYALDRPGSAYQKLLHPSATANQGRVML